MGIVPAPVSVLGPGKPRKTHRSLDRNQELLFLSADSLVVEYNPSKVVTRVRFPLGARGFPVPFKNWTKIANTIRPPKLKSRIQYGATPNLPASMDPNGLLQMFRQVWTLTGCLSSAPLAQWIARPTSIFKVRRKISEGRGFDSRMGYCPASPLSSNGRASAL